MGSEREGAGNGPQSAQERRTAQPEGQRMGCSPGGREIRRGRMSPNGPYELSPGATFGRLGEIDPMTGDPDDYWPSENTRRGIFGQPETRREATCICRTTYIGRRGAAETYQLDMSGCPAHASNPVIDGEATDA